MKNRITKLLFAFLLFAIVTSGAWAAETINSNTTQWGNDLYKNFEFSVTGNVTINERITVKGIVTLILNDGCMLTAKKGITVMSGNYLTITTPSGSQGSGKLIALVDGEDDFNAAIGGEYEDNYSKITTAGTINILSGHVTATVTANSNRYSGSGAAIGGCRMGACGTVNIKGGVVDAYSKNGAGIGGGWGSNLTSIIGSYGGGCGTITIEGGTVNAKSNFSAAIGSGAQGYGTGKIIINSGTVKAECEFINENGNIGGRSAAIGGGCDTIASSPFGTVEINGGKVEAISTSGAAIGNGAKSTGGSVIMTKGEVTAKILSCGSAIGCGYGGKATSVKISGGTIDASATIKDSRIGICVGGDESSIEITGGEVKTTVSGTNFGCAIGGDASTIKIDDVVISPIFENKEAYGIGYGDNSNLSSSRDSGTVIFTNNIESGLSGFNGIIFDEKNAYGNGKVYGNAKIVNLTIPLGKELVIPAGTKLTIPNGANLTLENGAKIINDGTVDIQQSGMEISSLNMTGSGTVKKGGQDYNTDGTLKGSGGGSATNRTLTHHTINGRTEAHSWDSGTGANPKKYKCTVCNKEVYRLKVE